MKKQLFLIVSVLLALTFTSCSKKMGELSSDYFKVTPNPLEVKGGRIDAKIDGKFPEKYFNKKAIVTVTPVLVYDGKEMRAASKTFQGEKVTGNSQVIKNKQGGNLSMTATFNYEPEMAVSELYLDFDIQIGNKEMNDIPMVKVADGVIATEALANLKASEIAPALTPDKFQRIIQEKQEADIKFLIQQADLRNSEKKSQAVKDLTAAAKDANQAENKAVSSLNVIGYASPDGPLQLNKNLAERRLNVTSNFLNSEFRRMKDKIEIGKDFTPEDWEGFRQLMEQSDIQDKELILRVLSMYTDPEQREREIKNISSAYTVIADQVLPQLRRSRLQLVVDVIGKSDEEIASLAKGNAQGLNVDELLYAATLTDNLTEKAKIYQKVIDNYSNDVRGYNNLALIRMHEEKTDEAHALLVRAERVSPNDPNVNYNLGLIALQRGQYDRAEEYFGKAAGTNGDMNQAMGTLYLSKGDYNKAKSSFGPATTNNAALLQILNKDYNAARRTLSSVSDPNAMTAYLGAIVGARTNDRDAVYSNLKTAVSKNRGFASKANRDLEFAKFKDDETFKSIVK
ncbi:hypothetical protein LJB95_01625 [Paludibacteraceae bacterium OttesenSCG-928-F17]|nr:hypothetical protein [Paludibacteraceae bacterium OttesenSCG-928-F17]